MDVFGKLVDIHKKEIFPAKITVEKGEIQKIERNGHRGEHFILPGFIDPYLHIESTLMPPSEFAQMAIRHGTLAAKIYSHDILNVLGETGKEFIENNARRSFLKFFFSYEKPKICETLTEGRAKIAAGEKIYIPEGSMHKNLNALYPLLLENPDQCLLCSEFLTPDHLMLGHINLLVKKALQNGMDLFEILRVTCQNPVEHDSLDIGLLREGDSADFILVEDLQAFRVLEGYIKGVCVFKESVLFPHNKVDAIDVFIPSIISEKDLEIIADGKKNIRILSVVDCNTTKEEIASPLISHQKALSDLNRDLVKIALINIKHNKPPFIGFVKNFGIKKGAVATSHVHGSNAILVIGATDRDMVGAVNGLIQAKGGFTISLDGRTETFPLPIAGLLSNLEGEKVARTYSRIEEGVQKLGCKMKNPLSFLSTLTDTQFPQIRITEKGLYDTSTKSYKSLFV